MDIVLSSFSFLRNPFVMRGPHQLQLRTFTFCSYASFDSLIFLPPSNNKQGKCVAAQAAPLQLSTNNTHTSTTSTNGKMGVLLSAQRPRDASQIDSDFDRPLHEKKIAVSDKEFNGTLKRGQAVKDCQNEQREKAKNKKNREINSSGDTVRAVLDLCSKMGDFMGAIKLYVVSKKEGIQMNQYHFGVLLYLCSSAATGIVKPAKSGNQSLKPVEKIEYAAVFPVEKKGSGVHGCVDTEIYPDTLDGLIQHIKARSAGETSGEIQVNEDMKRIAIEKGLEIYNEMLLENIPMNEALYTAAARMAMAIGDGYLAFEIVKKMKTCGIEPRLRSYSPALATFCSSGDVLNAFKVESHMLENGVKPEEPELRALLKVSIEARKSDKVYYILHKLRESVRKVSPATAELIEGWFCSKLASRVGKRKCDPELIVESRSNGGGWHGKGWLGKGKWSVCQSCVRSDGFCNACGEKLVSIDLDPAETEKFADSVAAIASKERNSSFHKFQKWLEYYGPFEAVVDAANVGLNNHRKFRPSKVHAVVNGIRQMLPSRKWPLLVLHHKRISGGKMDQPFNKSLIEKWRNADAIYATPSGSNDDWYWLYAAIKMKCLIVTNDEMRDHLFQLLGDDFFPKWKERHQVHFSFDDTGPVFHMPPPYSVDIQESAQGHWHIPIASEHEKEDERIWLCITRPDASKENHPKKIKLQRVDLTSSSEKLSKSAVCSPVPRSAMEGCYSSILPQLLGAESIGTYTPDFQI